MRSERPDLVLLDIMMPDMDGGDVYHRMQQDPELSQIPVIVVTAKTAPIDQAVWMTVAHVADYVTKPFNADDLLASVERVLARQAER
jgi:DNA-binding response OmpR family regulator